MRHLRCCLCEWLIGLALKVSPYDYVPSVVEAAQIAGRQAYEDEFRKASGLPASAKILP
jgi:hypothetical protein